MARYEELAIALTDGYEAYARYWPAQSPRGAVLYHHGIQSHCGWYEVSAAALGEAGYAVLQVDRRGSGRNSLDRGHADSADQLIDDSVRAGEELVRRSGVSEYHIVGVSWGGKLAVAHHVRHSRCVESLSLVTPGLFPRVGVSKEAMATIGFAMLYEPHKSFDIPLNEADLLTSVPKWKRYFAEDALTLRQCTAGFYLASRRMDKIVARLAAAPPVPLHLFSAGVEGIIDNDRTTGFVGGLEWPEVRRTTFDAARHSLEFDVPDEYCAALVSFLNETRTLGASGDAPHEFPCATD